MNIEVTYIVKWQIKDNPNYVWTSCKKLINSKTGKEVKRTIKGLQAGYWIDRKFVKLSELKSKIELINQEKLPF